MKAMFLRRKMFYTSSSSLQKLAELAKLYSSIVTNLWLPGLISGKELAIVGNKGCTTGLSPATDLDGITQ